MVRARMEPLRTIMSAQNYDTGYNCEMPYNKNNNGLNRSCHDSKIIYETHNVFQ